MNLRPVETIGLRALCDLAFEGVDDPPDIEGCIVLPDRLPNLAWKRKSIRLPGESLLVADPLAIYHFVRIEIRRAVGLTVLVPQGESIDDGILIQSFAVEWKHARAHPQGPVFHRNPYGDFALEEGIFLRDKDGPIGVSKGLASEISHGMAALEAALNLHSE